MKLQDELFRITKEEKNLYLLTFTENWKNIIFLSLKIFLNKQKKNSHQTNTIFVFKQL